MKLVQSAGQQAPTDPCSMAGEVKRANEAVKTTEQSESESVTRSETESNNFSSTSSEQDAENDTSSSSSEDDKSVAPTDSVEPVSTTDTTNIHTDDGSSVNSYDPVAYQQYCQQYQQYCAQYAAYYNQPAPGAVSAAPLASDPIYAYYSQMASGPSQPAPPVGTTFEAGRAGRQLGHYFDQRKFSTALSPEMLAAQQAERQQQQARLTPKEIEAFRRKKVEKKRTKNRWFYE